MKSMRKTAFSLYGWRVLYLTIVPKILYFIFTFLLFIHNFVNPGF